MIVLDTLRHYIDVVRHNVRPMRFLLARALVKSRLSSHLVIRHADGFVLRFFPSNLSEQLWVDPATRDGTLDFFNAYLRPGDIVIDVGANIGDTCIVCARAVAPHGRVFAFEPHPQVYGWLEGNVRMNRVANVELRNLALGEADSTVCFSDQRRDDMNRVDSEGRIEVELRRLDGVLPAIANVDLMKVDVEGFEIFVLRGGEHTLARTRAVHIEIGEAHFGSYGYTTADLLGLLASCGFALYRFASARELQPIGIDFMPFEVENVVAVRDATQLAARLRGRGFTVGLAQP